MSDKMIFKQMALVMRDVGAVKKEKRNLGQGFNFRGVDDVMNALNGVLAEHGVICLPSLVGEPVYDTMPTSKGTTNVTKITMKYTFYAEDGSSVEAIVPGMASDSFDKATSKALSFAYKYGMIQVFSIPTEDIEDGDAHSDETKNAPAPRQQAQKQQSKPQAAAAPKSQTEAKQASNPTPLKAVDSERKRYLDRIFELTAYVRDVKSLEPLEMQVFLDQHEKYSDGQLANIIKESTSKAVTILLSDLNECHGLECDLDGEVPADEQREIASNNSASWKPEHIWKLIQNSRQRLRDLQTEVQPA